MHPNKIIVICQQVSDFIRIANHPSLRRHIDRSIIARMAVHALKSGASLIKTIAAPFDMLRNYDPHDFMGEFHTKTSLEVMFPLMTERHVTDVMTSGDSKGEVGIKTKVLGNAY